MNSMLTKQSCIRSRLISGRKSRKVSLLQNFTWRLVLLKTILYIHTVFWCFIMRVTYLGVSESAAFIAANSVRIPLYVDSVSAGFPSPAQDFVEKSLDLNELCVSHPHATFFVRAQGDSMIEAGIHSGDVLVVDRSLTARHGDIVIACIHGEMTVKTLELKPNVLLRPKNKAYKAIHITEESELEIFGVVTGVVRKYERH